MILLRSICQSEVLTTRKWIVIMQKSNNSCMKHKGVYRTMSDIWDEAFCEKSWRFLAVRYFQKPLTTFAKLFILYVSEGSEYAYEIVYCIFFG